MTIYIGPDGQKRVEPGDLNRRQRKALARLARTHASTHKTRQPTPQPPPQPSAPEERTC
jgi:hypothetical protein